MIRKFKALIFCIVSLFALIAPAAHADWYSIDGYYKNFSTVLDFPRYGLRGVESEPELMGMVLNRLRMDTRFELSNDIEFDFSYNFIPQIQDKRLYDAWVFDFDPGGYGYRLIDLERTFYPDDDDRASFLINQNLDRAFSALHFRISTCISGVRR